MVKIIWNTFLTMTVVISCVYAGTTTDDKTKIIGGNKTTMGELPSMVAIMSGNKFHCGASLINRHCSLTAAHCIANPLSPYGYKIVVGVHDMRNYDTEYFAKMYPVKKIFIHPRYTDSGYDYDLAIVCTKHRIEFNHDVKPTKLPKLRQVDYCNHATVFGSGATSIGDSTLNLQKVNVSLVSNAECNFKYGKVGVKIHRHELCYGLGRRGPDNCGKISGGPLVCNTGYNIGTQIGIVSFGFGCTDPKYPVVYTRVSHFLKWITQTKNRFTKSFVNYTEKNKG